MEIRAFRNLSLLGILGCISVATLLATLNISPEQLAHSIPLKCPLLFITGIHCPTCGLGRALVSAVGGEWRLSLSYHPLALPVLFLGILAVLCSWLAPKRLLSTWNGLQRCSKRHPLMLTLLLITYTAWGMGRWYF